MLFSVLMCRQESSSFLARLLFFFFSRGVSERYCSRKRARILLYFYWLDSQSSFSWILFTSYSSVTLRSNSTSVSVHTYDFPLWGAIVVFVPFPLITSGFWLANVALWQRLFHHLFLCCAPNIAWQTAFAFSCGQIFFQYRWCSWVFF